MHTSFNLYQLPLASLLLYILRFVQRKLLNLSPKTAFFYHTTRITRIHQSPTYFLTLTGAQRKYSLTS